MEGFSTLRRTKNGYFEYYFCLYHKRIYKPTQIYHNNEHGRVRPPLNKDILSELPDGGRRPPVADDGDAGLDVPDQD
jgi:hypothetical protein